MEDDKATNAIGRVPFLWDVYADVKYWSRQTKGPRNVDGSVTIEELAVSLLNVLEAAWRQGIRNEKLRDAALNEMKKRKAGC